MVGEFVATVVIIIYGFIVYTYLYPGKRVHQLELLKPEESFLHLQDLESYQSQSARYPAKKDKLLTDERR